MTKDEVLRLALEALELCTNQGMIPMYLNKNKDAITAIKAALSGEAQQDKDEPVIKAIEEQAYESGYSTGFMDGAIKAQEAKDEAVAVAWANRDGTKFVGNGRKWIHQDCIIPLYTTSPQRTWVGLTEAECGVLWKVSMTPFDYYKAIEAKLKEKNT